MAQKTSKADGYKLLSDAIKSGQVGRLYILHGEERYLLERGLVELRKRFATGGFDEFNYKRFEGRGFTTDALGDAVDTLPVFAERTLVEVHDYNIFKNESKEKLRDIVSDLPDYVCVVFVFDTVAYKPDGRVKLNAEILKKAEVIEFNVQEQEKLINWIKRHYSTFDKRISTADAEYLAFITGGYMSSIHGEVGKTAAYAKGEVVTRADIDAVVTPVIDTVAYKLADALARRDHKEALVVLDGLFQMREAPHKLIFSISQKMRQLLAARVCIECSSDKAALMEMCAIRHEFQARMLMDTARRMTLAECRKAVLYCADTALELNSAPEPESRMVELITKLAFC